MLREKEGGERAEKKARECTFAPAMVPKDGERDVRHDRGSEGEAKDKGKVGQREIRVNT